MKVFELVTPRLRLYAPTLEELLLLLDCGRVEVERRLGVRLPDRWPGAPLMRALPIITEAMGQEPGDARWVWVVIEPGMGQVIGDVGYHGPLHDGATVEVGYALLPEAQGMGYATEAVGALIAWTFAQTRVAQVIAQIDPANAASLRVAAKLGMQALPAVSPGYVCFGIARA